MVKVLLVKYFLLLIWLAQTSWTIRVTDFDIQDGLNELEMVPDHNGRFYQINVTKRQIEYAKAQIPDYDVNFYVLTRQNPLMRRRVIVGDVDSLIKSNFNPAHPIRILTHGWLGSANAYINTEIPKAYFKRGDFNIIIVDWSDAAVTLDYYSARRSITQIGQKLAELLEFLFKQGDIDPRSVYLIGHSLGAHVSGVAARNIDSGRIGVIVALDTALPLFSEDHKDRLTKEDAEYVLSIHTNGGGLGMFDPVGHASFYPNYGKRQPGCLIEFLGACSHSRCIDYFAESVKYEKNNFMSRKCNSFFDVVNKRCWTNDEIVFLGGEPINTSFTGIFYLQTNAWYPFGMGTI